MEDLIKELSANVAKSIINSNNILENVQELENNGAPEELLDMLMEVGAEVVMSEAEDEIKNILEKYIK